MSFLAKTDYSGLSATGGALNGMVQAVSSNDGAAYGGTAMAKDSNGVLKALQPYRLNYGASNTFKMIAPITAGTTVKIGGGTHTDVGNFCLTGFGIETSNEAAPTFTATVAQAEDGDTAVDAYGAQSVAITEGVLFRFKAQSLFGLAATDAGAVHTTCYLQSASYNVTCDSSQVTVTDPDSPTDNGIKANAVSVVRVEATVTYKGNASSSTGNAFTVGENGSTGCDITMGDGWFITSPVACDNPEEDFPTFTFSATKYLDLAE